MATFVIAGVVRNCADKFRDEVSIIENAFKNHSIARIVLVESDSEDRSSSALAEWNSEKERNTVFSVGRLASSYPRRTERLAYCRNIYLKYFEHYDYFGADYLFVSDMDGVNSLLSAETIDHVTTELLGRPGDAATANQLYRYYDIWALRHRTWSPNDCWASFQQLKQIAGEVAAHKLCNEDRMIHLKADSHPIEVESSFGGGAIYSVSKLRGCRYNGLFENQEVCEHVSFSADYRRNGGRLYVFPSFINHDKSEHVLNAEQFEMTRQSASMINNG